MKQSKERILKSLEPLFEMARTENLLFHCTYQDLWFTPDELKKYNDNGLFIWHAQQWTLLPLSDKLAQIDAEIERLEKQKKQLQGL